REEWWESVFRLYGKHPAMVHLAPALVGPPDSGLVRAGRQGLRRADGSRSAGGGRQALRKEENTYARRRRPRHMVLFGAVAVLHARLAQQHRRAEALLPDVDPGDRL